MRRFNLLPADILAARRYKKTVICLLAAQLIIAAAVLLSFPAIGFASEAAARRSEELVGLISDAAFDEPDRLVEDVAELMEIVITRDVLLSSYPPEFLEAGLLDAATKAVPEGAQLNGFAFAEGVITLNCRTESLDLAERHRRNLNASGLKAAIGGISASDGLYLYELNVRPGDDGGENLS